VTKRNWGCSSVAECLSSMCEFLDLIPSTVKNEEEITTFPKKDNLREFITSTLTL
jgi:hypothetical protein